MRTEGKVSKVALCQSCGGYVLACHVDAIDRKTENEFTKLTNEGFDVNVETIKETQGRAFSLYSDCIKH